MARIRRSRFCGVAWMLILAAHVQFSTPVSVEASEPGYSAVFYVAPDGDDGNPGTEELPLQSLEAARQKIRDLKTSAGIGPGGAAVFLREGTWIRTESFVLSNQDGGEANRPVVWRAFPGEMVRLLGSAAVDPAWFAPVSSGDAEWNRLPEEGRGNVLRVRLSDHGISDFGHLRVRGNGNRATGALELFVDELPMPLSRWPDRDEHDGQQSHQDTELIMFGSTVPDVSGGWTKSGTRDGVNAYTRDDLVDGITYHLYRFTWLYEGNWYTAWFIAAQDDGYPGDGNPWWSLYSDDLGTFNPSGGSGAAGNPTTLNSATINWGFATIDSRISDTTFTMASDRPSRWTTAADPWFLGFWKHYWAETHVNASSINPGTRTIVLAEEPSYGIASGMPFFAENLLEEITQPGEWYMDRATGYLYWWPEGGIGGREIMVSMLEEPLLQVDDAEHLQFLDISFGMGRQDLVVVEGGSHVVFERCRFFGAGNDGIRLTGENHVVKRSEVVDVGDRGVVLTGGERSSLLAGNNLVENSEIHRFGRWSWTYMPGIQLIGVGNRAAHNHLHDAPHSAILFRGNQHRIEYNEINDVCQWSSDAGAVYSGRRWGWRGNRIDYNFIHDIDSPFPGFGEHGVYLDDCLSGIRVFGNLFVDVSGHAMMHGGGRDDFFENNIAVRCGTALSSDSRGFEWIKNDRSDWDLRWRLHDDGVEYQQQPWCSTWPELCEIPDADVAPGAHWRYPEGSVFSRNLGWQNDQFTRENDWGGTGTFDKFAEIADNIEDTDPLFVNEATGDFRLRGDSPALSIPGFFDIPFEEMGIVDETLIFQDDFERGDISAWLP